MTLRGLVGGQVRQIPLWGLVGGQVRQIPLWMLVNGQVRRVSGSATFQARREAVWKSKIESWIATPLPVQVTVAATGNVQGAIVSAIAAAAARPGTPNPLTHRARVVVTPGTCTQELTFVAARSANVAIELVSSTGNPADVIVHPTTAGSALEHTGVTCVVAGITFRKSTGTTWPIHGSGLAGIAHEMVVHNVVLDAQNGADAFSHELGGKHTLYMSGVKAFGGIYQHTIAPTTSGATLAMWDDCYTSMGGAMDESIDAADLVLVRSGWHSSGKFDIGFQRTGSASNPKLSAVIDPASGMATSNSTRVTFADPPIAAHPILDQNPVMLAAYA